MLNTALTFTVFFLEPGLRPIILRTACEDEQRGDEAENELFDN